MNIFLLNENPLLCAEQHCDKHVVKMVIEYAQLMSTAHRYLDGELYGELTDKGRKIKRWRHPNSNMEATLYKASHVNHPDGLWVRNSSANYDYLYDLWLKLCKEYTHRYGRLHLTQEKLEHLLRYAPKNIRFSSAKMTVALRSIAYSQAIANNFIVTVFKNALKIFVRE